MLSPLQGFLIGRSLFSGVYPEIPLTAGGADNCGPAEIQEGVVQAGAAEEVLEGAGAAALSLYCSGVSRPWRCRRRSGRGAAMRRISQRICGAVVVALAILLAGASAPAKVAPPPVRTVSVGQGI